MGYQLKPDHTLEAEVRRIADERLAAAIAALTSAGDRVEGQQVHDARRHVKKVRALVHLLRPALAGAKKADARLRMAGRLLAPLADADAIEEALIRLLRKYPSAIAREARADVLSRAARRCAVVRRRFRRTHVLRDAAAALRRERLAAWRWRVVQDDFDTIAPGLLKSMRKARRAMKDALGHPSAETLHTWRRRVKDHWLQVRLLKARCGDVFSQDERRLEMLDGALGELHNFALLEELVAAEPGLDTRVREQILRLLRRDERDHRATSGALAAEVYARPPREIVRRARRGWREATRGSTAAVRTPWRRAA
jgi:CHAD domain-containing protein